MLKQRKNKKFDYKPRFSKQNNSQDSLAKSSQAGNFSSKWQRERNATLAKSKRGLSFRTLVLILVLLLICMYILDKKFM